MPDEIDDTLAGSPKDSVTGKVKPHQRPSERPGSEAKEADPPRAPPGDGPGHDTEEAAAYRENDA